MRGLKAITNPAEAESLLDLNRTVAPVMPPDAWCYALGKKLQDILNEIRPSSDPTWKKWRFERAENINQSFGDIKERNFQLRFTRGLYELRVLVDLHAWPNVILIGQNNERGGDGRYVFSGHDNVGWDFPDNPDLGMSDNPKAFVNILQIKDYAQLLLSSSGD